MPAAAGKSSGPVLLVCGEDDFAVKQRASQLYREWTAEVGGMDHETIDAAVGHSGEALKAIARLREALQTLPFFGSGKVVWFQNCNFLADERTATADVTESLADLAQDLKSTPWQNLRLLISALKVDKRKVFFKTLDKIGTVEFFAGWSVDDKDWEIRARASIRETLVELKKGIQEEALEELVSRIGPNPRQLRSEVEKLALFAADRPEIRLADVEEVCIRNKMARAFALADALGERNLPLLLRRLDEELWRTRHSSQASEIGLLYGLISKVRSLILLQELAREGWIKPGVDYGRFKAQLERIPAEQMPQDKRYNPLQIHPFVLFKSLGQVQRYTQDELVKAMELLLQCNQRLVTSSLDEALVLQQTLAQIAAEAPSPQGAAARTRLQ